MMMKYMTEIPLFSQTCSMSMDQATLVLEMLETHEEFAEIGVDIHYDVEKIGCIACGKIPEENILVVFGIPRNISMPVFFGEFHKALNRNGK